MSDNLDISITALWQWVCWSCRDPADSNVPGAYGDADSVVEASIAVAEHVRHAHRGPRQLDAPMPTPIGADS